MDKNDKTIYFDNAATTALSSDVAECINNINNKIFGNSSSMHTMGIEAEKIIEKSRVVIASTLGVNKEEIYFTSGGTESNNLAIMGYLKANKRNGNHILTTQIEHPSVYEVFEYMKSFGYNVDYIPVDSDGKCDIDFIENMISDTNLISVMHTNNETGSIQDLSSIVQVVKSLNALTKVHVDFIQGYCKIPLDARKIGIDLMTVSSHKIHGPKGVGALYVKKGTKISPILYGGGQENGIRSGTENTSAIAGFAVAAEHMHSNIEINFNKVYEISNYFRKQIEICGLDNKILSPKDASPYILNIAFKNTKSEVLLHHLEQFNIFVSSGSACFSKKKKQSRILSAMGIQKEISDGAIRFSFSEESTKAEVDKTIARIKEIIPIISIKTRRKR